MRRGALVFVQLVIDATTTAPCPISFEPLLGRRGDSGQSEPSQTTVAFFAHSSSVSAKPRSWRGARSDFWNAAFISRSAMRS